MQLSEVQSQRYRLNQQWTTLVEALRKVPWLDGKIKELNDDMETYDLTYQKNKKMNKRANAIDYEAATKISKISEDVVGIPIFKEAHPNFNAHHDCCPTGYKSSDRADFELYNRVADEHATLMETAQEIKDSMETERDKYQAVIDQAVRQ